MSVFTTIQVTREQAIDMVVQDIVENKHSEIRYLVEFLTNEILEKRLDEIGKASLYNYTINERKENNDNN